MRSKAQNIIKQSNKVLGNLTDKQLECYSSNEDFKRGVKNGGIVAGNITFENNLGIHTEDEELRREWAIMGGEASIDTLLEWQKENNHNIGEIAKNKDDEWKSNISKSLKGRKLSKEHIEKNRNALKKYMESLSSEERSKRFSNDSASRKSLRVRTEILNSIQSDIFTTAEARIACENYGLGNWKAFLKDKRIIEQIHKGTNKNNPSLYKKINCC